MGNRPPAHPSTYAAFPIQEEGGTGVAGEYRRWYVPSDRDPDRFIGSSDGLPPLHLIRYRDSYGELVLRLCEDSTGLLVGPTDRRLPAAGIYVAKLRGVGYYPQAAQAGDFSLGTRVRPVREPDNEYDPYAVAVHAWDRAGVCGYVNRMKARQVAKLMDAGHPLKAVSLRGTAAGVPCPQITVVMADPTVVDHLLAARPTGAAPPAHLAPPPGEPIQDR